ncbi:molybdopterin-guanine dinucleotide biosynthesis protein B [Myxococcota bacterium]|nr:molybdopterin-guanine dinucleotide biosynthesis protein B [Myxococcota bacterium]
MPPLNLLFLCVANSARSQLAEALARHLLGPAVVARSAGSRPGRVHPLALRVLAEVGVDTTGLRSKHVDELDPTGVDLVLTLCAEEECPLFLGRAERRSWALPDPAGADEGATEQERLLAFRAARDQVHARLLALARERGLPLVGTPDAAHPPSVPTVAVVGWKDAGKTTLVEGLVRALTARGLRVGTVKATHHDVEPDAPGKDSWRHRRAGAVETLLVGPRRWVLTREEPQDCAAALARMSGVDVVVVEGLRGAALPKVEVVSPGSARPLLAGSDPLVFLLAADPPAAAPGVPALPRDDVDGIATAVVRHLGLRLPSGS